MRQSFDMAHRQRRAIQEEEGATGCPVIAPHFGGAILAHKGRLAERGLQAGHRHIEILARLAARRSLGNGGSRGNRRRRGRFGRGTTRSGQGQDQARKAAQHLSLLHQHCLAHKVLLSPFAFAAYKRNT